MSNRQTQLYALRRLLGQVELGLLDEPMPKGFQPRCRELIGSAQAIVGDLITQSKIPAAAELGKRGGEITAKRGSTYFRDLASKRKTFGGGRPPKTK